MSIHVMNKVWRESPAKGSELLLLLAMADWADDEGWCYPSLDTLSKKTRLSRRQVINLVKTCEEKKYIKVDRSNGKTKSNRYQVITSENFSPAQLFPNGEEFTTLVNSTSPALVNSTSPNTSIEPSHTRQDSNESISTPTKSDANALAKKFVGAFYEALGVPVPTGSWGPYIRASKTILEYGCTLDEVPQYVAFMNRLEWRKGPVTLQFASSSAVWEQYRMSRHAKPKANRPVL